MGDDVVFLNPRTCGIYKNGNPLYKTDPETGKRTDEIDNEVAEHVKAFQQGERPPGMSRVKLGRVKESGVLVPRFYDFRWQEPFDKQARERGWESVSLGELEEEGILFVGQGHGSPGNDQRNGHIPYIKVSDIRGLRINVNPTNLVTEAVAKQNWRDSDSGLRSWDVITPNRASSNIGEFAILLPGEEEIVLTKEVFVLRVIDAFERGWSPFYLLWALSLKTVRRQWRRVTLMQTNREDVSDRYREILLPRPKSKKWADEVSGAFANYFRAISEAQDSFRDDLEEGDFEYIASALSVATAIDEEDV